MEQIDKYLREHDIKPSLQRIAIMEYLQSHKTHPTADEIFNALYPSIPTLSKTTVYNTLKLFVEHNAALCLTIDDKTAHFDGDTSFHAHFFCLGCGCIYDIPIADISNVLKTEIDDLTITETHIYYKGYCKKCLEEKLKKQKEIN
ncbi:MAG TPA: transcriptional repressor [Paludibacteraceae bacterium]|nr:transcriptional repressor [Paludibacteraceae bacterium]HOU67862.1 transcriptional repressor [Paludibacteraceae bacterium]HPH62703.1 transcriptional repressor [Paludibacteraceae bacterium]HQF49687.1 transcriptional repressor [Paludibacteraceae bacterium]HQJ90837.1 transcriptional repressor [Paludibacteraceae bacterium]